MAIQMDLFEDTSELGLIQKRIDEIQDSMNRTRKAEFAKLNDMGKLCLSLKDKVEKLEAMVSGNSK